MKNEFFKSMVTDNSGGISYTRVNCFIWSTAVLVMWLVACFFSLMIRYQVNKTQLELVKASRDVNITTNVTGTNYLPGLPEYIVAILLGFHGLKSVQRFAEKPEEGDNSNVTSTTTAVTSSSGSTPPIIKPGCA